VFFGFGCIDINYIYLNSNDNTRSKFKNGPGKTHSLLLIGFQVTLSAGWYLYGSIPSFECVGVSISYYVVPGPTA